MTNDSGYPLKRAIRVTAADNVATLLDDVECGPVAICGQDSPLSVEAIEPIARGHKIALVGLSAGSPIVKFGVPIGLSTVAIKPGQWVHLHNCRSRVDERSSGLDVRTGAAKDTPYA